MRDDDQQFFLDVARILAEVPFGSQQFEVKRHNNKVSQLIVSSSRTDKYREENAKAVGKLIQAIKEANEMNFTGSMTFTVVFHNGQISKVLNQAYKQINY